MHAIVRSLAVAVSCVFATAVCAKNSVLGRIENIVVIYGENRSFDNLYGLFPGANGIENATDARYRQVNNDGKALANLPPVWQENSKTNAIDPAFVGADGKPIPLPNMPFRLDQPPFNLSIARETRDLVHRFYQNQEQINGGKNDKFAAVSDAGGLVMGYYNGSAMKMWQWAQEYTLADHFFMGAFGGSFMNHLYLVCACVAEFPNPPASLLSMVSEDHKTLVRDPNSPVSALNGAPLFKADKALTPDGFAVNTLQPPYQPSGIPPAPGGDPAFADPAKLPLPPQTQKTIGDALSEKNISWAWYAGAWNVAVSDGQQTPEVLRNVIYNRNEGAPNFQAHHQPFNYFANYAPGTTARVAHLKDLSDFENDIAAGSLPAVSFYKPQGSLNQHPGYTDVLAGDEHIAGLVEKIKRMRPIIRVLA